MKDSFRLLRRPVEAVGELFEFWRIALAALGQIVP